VDKRLTARLMTAIPELRLKGFLMGKRRFFRKYGCVLPALFVVLSGVQTALGQRASDIDLWTVTSSDVSLAAMTVQEVPPPDSALTSVEQGKPNLDQSFEDFRQWRLEKRRKALEDTEFVIHLRSFYFDRSDFTGAEKQAWAFGGWAGIRTGYFLDHIAFGATLYTTTPVYAPDDRDGTSLLEEGQNGFTVLGEFYANVRITEDVGVTVGAKGYDTPFISRNDNRMLPNTFGAAVLQGRDRKSTRLNSSHRT